MQAAATRRAIIPQVEHSRCPARFNLHRCFNYDTPDYDTPDDDIAGVETARRILSGQGGRGNLDPKP